MATPNPDVEVYRRPTDGNWIALCWLPGCRWTFGTTVSQDEARVRQQAKSHRRKHTREGDRG